MDLYFVLCTSEYNLVFSAGSLVVIWVVLYYCRVFEATVVVVVEFGAIN